MKRRAKTGRNAVKTQRRKTLSRRDAPKSARNGTSATARQETEVVRLTRELHEAREQQAATSEVLGVISSSPGELGPVFDAILENATRICGGRLANLFLYSKREHAFRLAAQRNAPAAYAERWVKNPVLRIGENPRNPLERLAKTRRVVAIPDLMVEPGYINRDPRFVALVEGAGARTHVLIPMLKEGELVGGIAVYRQKVLPFTDRQIELLRNFAAQAVIAIENARLLTELRQRTDDLSEALEQQTATSDVLKIISSAPGDLEPVFKAMLAKAIELCEASFGAMWLVDGDDYRTAALHGNLPEAYAERWRSGTLHHPKAVVPMVRAVRSRNPVHVPDMLEDKGYLEGDTLARSVVDIAGIRTLLTVPMLKENEAVGVITIYRNEVRSFSDKQIELLKNFAAQAVIAIENARLLSELRESLQQQTATADVLKVISSSPGELQPVFDTMLSKATELCEANYGTMWLSELGGRMRTVALHGPLPPAYREGWGVGTSFQPNPSVPSARVLETHRPVQVADLREDRAYLEHDPLVVSAVEVAGIRSLISIPMLKDRGIVGAIAIYRTEVRPFTDKQIEVVQNFAAQAVIAIENTRLLSELRESLQQQTATADVLKVISRSTFELQPVFDSMAESAVRLCEAERAYIFRFDGQVLRAVASFNAGPENKDWVYRNPIPLGRHSVSARAGLERRTVQVADIQADPEYSYVARDVDPIRTTLAVPMLRGDELIGTITIYRLKVRPFTENQIALMETFADQAVIAIENARLFESLQARTHDLAKSLEELRTTQDRLVQTQKLASLGQLTAGIAHEIKNPLNFVNNFSGVSAELIDELQDALKGPIDDKVRAEIKELTDTLKGNLDKIVQHGKRADSIVKNMLLHSREGSGEHRSVDINALVEESLNLAYHGARAEKQGFNVTLKRSFDPAADQADLYPQDITRVLLNLILNGFYATTKRKAEAGDGYKPTLLASTRNLGDRVEIRVRDNGTGIPPEVKDKMFNPFFTTKPAGEGTGLGLSISHDIIVKQHGGSIEVETEPGKYTEFRIILPRAAAFVTASGAQ